MGDATQDDEQDFDLTTLDGIGEFVEFVAEQTRQTIFHTKGLPATCAVFALKDPQGCDLENPMPIPIPPVSTEWKTMRKVARQGYLKFNARGVLRVHNEGRRILFQLEHVEHGDLVWYATPDDSYMLGKLVGPVPLAKLEFPELRVLPARYMS